MGYTGFPLTSVRPFLFVCQQGLGNYLKKDLLNSFHTWCLLLWGESLDLSSFSFSCRQFWASGRQIFPREWVSSFVLYKLFVLLIWCLAFPLLGCAFWPLFIFMFLLFVFGHLLAKYMSIFLILGIQIYRVRFLTPIQSHVPTINAGSVVPNNLAKFFRIFSIHGPPVDKTLLELFWKHNFLEGFPPVQYPQWLPNSTLCWIFLDKADNDRSGCIVSPIMGTPCLWPLHRITQ